ncbi:hypothetical protein RCH18_001116 [Flavobacterium sp. PL11]|nr:hypothetical protein [Flavobacterium sp. PL11]
MSKKGENIMFVKAAAILPNRCRNDPFVDLTLHAN